MTSTTIATTAAAAATTATTTATAAARGASIPREAPWTEEQWDAITARGCDLLVSAAAGAGKTAVLVKRVIGRITDPARPLDIDRLLVVTFTDTAAAEMRERIASALDDLIAKEARGAGTRLARQLALVRKADISTIHSFCHRVVRQYFYRLDIDPAFRVMDEVEAELLRLEVADDLFERCYADSGNGSGSGGFIELVDAYGGDSGDEALRDLVTGIYDYSRGRPRPEAWFGEISKAFNIDAGTSINELTWTQIAFRGIARDLARAQHLLLQALELSGAPGGPEAYVRTLQEEVTACSEMRGVAKVCDFSALAGLMKGFRYDSLPGVRAGTCDDALKQRVKALRDEAKKLVHGIRDVYFSRPAQDLVEDLRSVAPLMHKLVEVVRAFAAGYAKAKYARSLVDFSDLEHLCLQVLGEWDEDSGRFRPTDVARELAGRYDEILIDEYQDINPVQDAILGLIAGGGNTFMVGDVKQSIYGFRLAEPKLFAEKCHEFSAAPGGARRRIDLSRNFRSRRTVIDAVNLIFRQVLSEGVASIEYDPAAELVYGADYPPGPPGCGADDAPVEIHIIERKPGVASVSHETPDGGSVPADDAAGEAEDDGAPGDGSGEGQPAPEEVEALELEGRLIAGRINEMVRGAPARPGPEFHVYDRGRKAYRPVSYRDIVVLMRSTRERASVLLEVFRQADVPAYAELGTGYFEATEVEVMVSLLRVIDNPMQDIPLAAVLRSPVCGLSADDLARIRMCGPDGDFHAALQAARSCTDHGDLASRVGKFLDDLDRWRTLARRSPLSTLVWSLYRETGYLDYVGGMPGGAQRQANLRALHERARQFDRFARQGLFRFMRFIDRLRDAEGDLGTARALGEAEDVVRIMSVHKSKGLEFPVVFVADLGKNFNFRDLSGDVLFHSEAGLGPVFSDPVRRVKHPTLAHRATRELARARALAEEMRILYVAMTRAKERLVLVGSAPGLEKQAARWCGDVSQSGWGLSEDVVLSARSFLDWVASAVARHRSGFRIRELATVHAEPSDAAVRDDPACFEVKVWDTSDVPGPAQLWKGDRHASAGAGPIPGDEMARAKPLGREVPPELRRAVEDRLAWAYPHAALAGRAAKATWSEIKRRFEPGRDDAEPSREDASEAHPAPATFPEQPRFMQQYAITPAERGQATHLVLQHLDLGGKLDVAGVRRHVNGMVERDLLTRDLARSVDAAAIAAFFATPLGKRLVAMRDRVRREVPFYLGIDAGVVYPDISTGAGGRGRERERVVVQGIVDCLIDEGDGFVLIDFKTDAGARRDPDAAARAYSGQIAVYAAACEATFGRPVKEAYLYFLGAGVAVPLDCRRAARRLLRNDDGTPPDNVAEPVDDCLDLDGEVS